MKEMSVAELIEELSKIENKTLPVRDVNRIRILSAKKSAGFKNERVETWVDLGFDSC